MADRSDSARERAQEEKKTPSGRPPRPVLWLIGFVALALVEFSGGQLIQARVPDESDWADAADYVDENWQTGDLAVAAPEWSDPLLRFHLQERIGVEDAGRADLAPYDRLWEFSIRGHVAAAAHGASPDFTRRFGRVLVRRYELGPSPVAYDLTSRILEAEVSVEGRACALQDRAFEGGGLFRGPMWPNKRFFCGPQDWLWVGPTVIEDLHLRNRACIWQHPQAGNVPTETTFRDVPLADEIVLHAGLYYDHERRLEQGPVTVQVLVDGEEVGRMIHRDGDGWERLVADPTPLGETKERGDVTIVVSAEDPHLRTLCWAASTRQTSSRDDQEPVP